MIPRYLPIPKRRGGALPLNLLLFWVGVSIAAHGQVSVDTTINAAVAAERNRQFGTAAQLYESVFFSPLFDSVQSYSKKQFVVRHLGDLYFTKLARPREAITVWKRGAALASSRRNLSDELVFLLYVGAAYIGMSDYRAANEYLLRSERLAQEAGDHVNLKRIYELFVNLYQDQGDSARARSYQIKRAALVDWTAIKDPGGVPNALVDEARSAAVVGNNQRALELYGEALKHMGETSPQRADTYYAMARVQEKADNLDEALGFYKAAYGLYQINASTPALANCASAIGVIWYQQGKLDSAIAYLDLALNLHARSESIEALATDYFNLGLVFLGIGNSEKARDAFARSVVLFEHIRSRVAGIETDDERRKYLASRLPAYEQLIGALFQNRSESLMFMVMELAQARTLFEALQKFTDRSEDRQVSIPFSEIRDGSSVEPLLLEVYRQAGHSSLDEVRRDLLGEEAALAEYFLGEDHSYVLVASRDEIATAELARPENLKSLVERYRKYLEIRAAPDLFIEACREISNALISPIWPVLKKKSHLYIIPSGPLWLIPFETLLVPELSIRSDAYDSLASTFVESYRGAGFLIRRMTLSYGQSASVLLSQLAQGYYPAKSLIAFADPSGIGSLISPTEGNRSEHGLAPIKHSRTEVQNIARLFLPDHTVLFIGEEASEENAKKALNHVRVEVVHFATHGFLSLGAVGRIGILLNRSLDEDGILEANEVARLQMEARLVVLSACETGLGDQVPGEGTMGLARAFSLAGANSVIVSLWRVTDLSTSVLMKKFYAEYASNGGRASAALQRAQISMIESEEYSAPYYWAPFILIGQ